MVTSGEREGRKDKKGVGGLEMQTTMYKINKQQGYTVQHGEYSYYFIRTIPGI